MTSCGHQPASHSNDGARLGGRSGAVKCSGRMRARLRKLLLIMIQQQGRSWSSVVITGSVGASVYMHRRYVTVWRQPPRTC